MIAYKTFTQCPVNQCPSGIPLDYPWEQQTCEPEEEEKYTTLGYTVVTVSQFEGYLSSLSSVYNAWLASQAPALLKQQVETAIQSAIDFGQKLIREFAAENVLLGVTQDNKTGDILDKTSRIMSAISSGSLYEAINRIREITPEEYDSKYITNSRMLAFINKIESYLNLPLSTSV
jgi:hypothetical protein